MTTVDEVRKLLEAVEAMAPAFDCCVDELETYAEPIVHQANVMAYSDVSCPESVLIAALILRLRQRLSDWERQIAPDAKAERYSLSDVFDTDEE
jgi:hypothetical protein